MSPLNVDFKISGVSQTIFCRSVGRIFQHIPNMIIFNNHISKKQNCILKYHQSASLNFTVSAIEKKKQQHWLTCHEILKTKSKRLNDPCVVCLTWTFSLECREKGRRLGKSLLP